MTDSKGRCLEELKEAILNLDSDKSKAAVMQAIKEGYDIQTIVTEGLGKGLQIMGERYESGDIFLPELTVAGDIANELMEIMKKNLKVKEVGSGKKVILATTKGDIHDLGKRIVGAMLLAAGYEVVDIGVDASEMKVVDEAQKIGADVICLSSSMTTTMLAQQDVIKLLREIGLRNNFKVIVGGGPVSQEWATKIGADGYRENAFGAISIMKELEGK